MGLALVGLLSYTACTAEKTAMKTDEPSNAVASAPAAPKIVDGVFASSDHLLPVYFDLSQSKLTEKSAETVRANAEWLKAQPPYLVRVVGYADSRGSARKNQRLAERRALTVRDAYLALGLPKERISIAARGAEEPACQPLTEECLSQSRRSETFIEDKTRT